MALAEAQEREAVAHEAAAAAAHEADQAHQKAKKLAKQAEDDRAANQAMLESVESRLTQVTGHMLATIRSIDVAELRYAHMTARPGDAWVYLMMVFLSNVVFRTDC